MRYVSPTLLAALISCAMLSSSALAQHSIDVQRSAAEGSFFEALRLYEKMSKRKATVEAQIAAGNAAWGLGLPERAVREYDSALRSKELSAEERARVFLSRGILEYQEGRFQVAVLFAEKTIGKLPGPSPLRSKAWLLWGESLSRLGSYGAAESKYLKALEEAKAEELPDIHYLLGKAQLRLGKTKEAQENFEKIPLHHERTPHAIRELAALAIESQSYEHAAFWLAKGRQDYPNRFLDSWVDFALVQVAIHKDDRKEVERLQEKATKKYPPSDHWLTLLNAAVDVFRWKRVEENPAEASNGSN